MLALPYYFEEEFVQRELDYLKGGGQFIFFLPKIKIVYWTDDGLKERVVWSPENKWDLFKNTPADKFVWWRDRFS